VGALRPLVLIRTYAEHVPLVFSDLDQSGRQRGQAFPCVRFGAQPIELRSWRQSHPHLRACCKSFFTLVALPYPADYNSRSTSTFQIRRHMQLCNIISWYLFGYEHFFLGLLVFFSSLQLGLWSGYWTFLYHAFTTFYSLTLRMTGGLQSPDRLFLLRGHLTSSTALPFTVTYDIEHFSAIAWSGPKISNHNWTIDGGTPVFHNFWDSSLWTQAWMKEHGKGIPRVGISGTSAYAAYLEG
jgi:hypothetical protein